MPSPVNANVLPAASPATNRPGLDKLAPASEQRSGAPFNAPTQRPPAASFAIDSNAAGAFASNGYGALSPQGYSMAAALLCEIVMTAFFLIVIMGATHGRAPVGFAGIAIGLALTLIHLISIPVTNTSVNPARSTGVALFAGSGAISQLWLFWLAPIIGAVIGGLIYRWLGEDRPDVVGNP